MRSALPLLLSVVALAFPSIPIAAPQPATEGAAVEPAGNVALVRHAPHFAGGEVDGSLWLLTGEDVALDGHDAVRGTLFVPGTPAVEVRGRAALGDRSEGSAGPEPSGYHVLLQGNAVLGRLVNRTDPQELEVVDPPPAPAGARDVKIERTGESAGDFTTVRDLALSGRAGAVPVPPGNYRRLSATGRTALVLGVTGSKEPAAYGAQEVELAGGAELRLAGPVEITVARRVRIEGRSVAGSAEDPRRLSLRVAGEGVTIEGGGALHAVVRAPAGQVSLGGKGLLRGTVASDRLRIAGGSVLEVVVDDLALRNQAPTVEAGEDQIVALPASASLAGAAGDDGLPRGSAIQITWSQESGPGAVAFADSSALATSASFSTAGTYVLRLTVTDSELPVSDDVTVTVDPANQAPTVAAGPDRSLYFPAAASLAGSAQDDGWPRGSSLTLAWSQVSGPGIVAFADAAAASTTASFSTAGSYVLRLTATDSQLSATDEIAVLVGPELPADPATVAPAPDLGVATSIAASTAFLYTGPDAIQTGVAPGAIQPVRVAVLRGRALVRGGEPLPDVTVRIADHPELGSTRTRIDGWFDLAVNGGGPVNVVYEKEGFLPVQRPAVAPWQDYEALPDVTLLELDPQVTEVALGEAAPAQVAQGSTVTDEDGSRQPTVLFPAGTGAEMVLPDGSTRPLESVHVRATEYTVGPGGPAAMPAPLPPNSAYTYAVELSLDEALAAGAKDVRFSRPVYHYVENFLGFPVGSPVPVGYLDREKNAWVPSENGRIVGIIAVGGDLAEVDLDGDGAADGPEALASLGVTEDERRQLARLYQPGQSLWRVPINHFSAWDCNWGFWPPPDAGPPNLPVAKSHVKPAASCQLTTNSVVECEAQVLGESLPVTGTPFHLTYRSDRMLGHQTGRKLEIPLSGAAVSGNLAGIDLSVEVAGQKLAQRFEPAPNQKRTFVWDGKDAYGREVQGSPSVSVTVAHAYRGYYAPVARFGYNGNGVAMQGDRARQETYFPQSYTVPVRRWDARGQGLGGWTFDVHHAYDPIGKVLYLGDGRERTAESVQLVIQTAAGGGRGLGDGGPATQAELGSPVDVAVGPDGSVYIGDQDRVRKVDRNGIITTYVGRGGGCYPWTAPCGDGGPATQAQLNSASGLAVGPDGSLYFFANARLRKVAPNGIITTIAGTGVDGFSGDGGPAVEARVSSGGIALAPDGTLYFADGGSNRIRRIGTDGIITTVAGTGAGGSGGDGGPALDARLNGPADVALGPDGSLYIAEGGNRVRKVSPAGIITTVAGPGCCQSSASHLPWHGDGGLATSARIDGLSSLAFGPDGGLYLMQGGYRPFVRRIGPDGIITTVAGEKIEAPYSQGLSGDGGPATLARFSGANALAVGPDGTIWVSDGMFWDGQRAVYNKRLRRISAYLPGFSETDLLIPSEDGAQLYVFDAAGRHLRTVSTLTRAVLYRFEYDTAGRLAAVVDGDGNTTRIERDGGRPVAIVGPYGQRTALEVDAEGYLARVANPAGEVFLLTYASGGMLASVTDPRGNPSRYEYDDEGRLAAAVDRAGNRRTWVRSDPTAMRYEVAHTDPLGAVTRYGVERLLTGDEVRTNTFADGTKSTQSLNTTSARSVSLPDGTSFSLAGDPDPRFGMQAPLSKSTTYTPGGKAMSVSTSRSVSLSLPGDSLSLTGMTETTNVNGRSSTRSYSATGRSFTYTSPAGRRSTAVLDGQGRTVLTQTVGLYPATATYDVQGRLVSIAQGSGNEVRTMTFGYDPQGLLSTVIDPLGRTARLEYDAAGRLTQQVLVDGSSILYEHDPSGNLTSVTTPAGTAHRFSYSPLGRETGYAPPEATADGRHSYDAAGRLSRVERPDGQVLGLHYDADSRLVALDLPDGAISYTYDPRTRGLISVTSPPGVTLSYAYDGALLTRSTWSGLVSGTIARTYDNDFRLTASSINGGDRIAFQYDGDSLLTRAGDLTLHRSRENGLPLSSTLGKVTDAWTHNGFGEPVHYNAEIDGSTVFAYQLTRDRAGRIIAKTETVGSVTETFEYTYDAVGRLAEARKNGSIATSYTYDANGNRLGATSSLTSIAASYDRQDRLIHYGETDYTFTGGGELTAKATRDGVTNYGYDTLGNLLTVALPDGRRIEYLVDGQRRRVGKQVDGVLQKGFLWDNRLHLAAELDGAGNLVSRFVYAGRANVPDYFVRQGAVYRIVADHLGSPRLVINATTGQIVQRMDYDEFGNVLQDTNPGFQPFGFTGGLYDPDTGLVRFGARDYDAAIGRWTTKDPLLFGGGDVNLYGYTFGDPVNWIDPSGLRCKQPFLKRWYNNFKEVNTLIPGLLLTPPLLTTATAGHVGKALETPTFVQWARSGFRGFATGGTQFTVAETAVLVGSGMLMNIAITSVSFEVGVAIGSAVNVAFLLPCEEWPEDLLCP